MEDKTQAFNVKKYVAIALMAVAVLMLCMNWFKLGDEFSSEAEELYEDLKDDMDREMDYMDANDLEELFEEEGYSSKEAKKLVKAVEGMYDMLEKAEEGKFSVFSIAAICSDISAMKPMMEDEDIIDASEEDVMVLTMAQTVLWIVVAIFAINGILMLFAIICYVQEKKAYGVISAILSGLMFVVFGGIMLLLKIGMEDSGIGVTFAPLLTFVCSLASCIVWKSARKMQESLKSPYYMNQ